jgi:hypothetical protein
MDIELERWKAAGKCFDYLGFNIFYRTEGSGPTLLLIHGYGSTVIVLSAWSASGCRSLCLLL